MVTQTLQLEKYPQKDEVESEWRLTHHQLLEVGCSLHPTQTISHTQKQVLTPELGLDYGEAMLYHHFLKCTQKSTQTELHSKKPPRFLVEHSKH